LAAKSLPAVALAASVVILMAAEVPRRPLFQANAALQAGEADKALTLLDAVRNSVSNRAEAENLECRVRFTLEQWNAAVAACQEAVNLDGENSDYHMWLGRALGEKAGRASFLSAFSLAKRTRTEFEEAVRLGPRNASALADLGEFYRSAPGVVGGGLGKAESVALELDRVDPARAYELRGRIAEERKDYGMAEREYKQAIASSPHPAFRWTTLADFYRRRQRWTEMEWAVESCFKAAEHDKHAGVPLFDGASVLIDANRDLPLAAKMLESYLAGSAKTEEAPAFVAYTRLARVEERLGDHESARKAQVAALALAHEYRPAQDLRVTETKH
jgi:tetratricopeptide (TPR) repeat protein